jgi:dinuclear metal center YbgI/SA1388 family protein
MKIREIVEHLESLAPLAYQETYDNSGMISGDPSLECTGVLVSLDCTEETVREAVEKKCNLLVSHHPLIFQPLRQIIPGTGQGRALLASIKQDIALYAIHTNLDNILGGVNASIADRIGLVNREILLAQSAANPSVGSGMAGDLIEPLSETELLRRLRELFSIPVIRHSPLRGKTVTRVGICGGAGGFLISNALQANCDFFISADIRYHQFFETEGKMVVADIGHYESEQFTIDLLYRVILEKFPNFAVLKSGTVTNPVHYYI